jgi:energy-coupling factor transporter ATP-binding protein EcfA2
MTRSDLHTVYDVFTPTSQAKLNFVPRNAVNDHVVDALRTPGKQVVVYGETGSGKSTLLERKLTELYTDHVTTRCSSTSTFDSIILDAFDQLGRHYIDTAKTTTSSGMKGGLKADFLKVQASIERQKNRSNETTTARVLPPQLTPQRLGEFLGAEGLCWVLEDFHKVPAEQKTPLSQTFKIFSDLAGRYPNVKIVAIGATDTARDVVQYDREMANRVAEIYVPLMSSDELSSIVRNGGELLNVVFPIENEIVALSSGLASVCHHLCLNACLAASIDFRQQRPVLLRDQELEMAIKRYIDDSSDSLKSLFEVALKRERIKMYDNTRLILSALAAAGPNGLLQGEILAAIQKKYPNYTLANMRTYLRQLVSEKRRNVLKRGVDMRYRFSEPMFLSYAQVLLGERQESALSSWTYEVLSEALRESAERLYVISHTDKADVWFRPPPSLRARAIRRNDDNPRKVEEQGTLFDPNIGD